MLVLLLRYCVECEQGFEESEGLAVLFGIEFARLFSYNLQGVFYFYYYYLLFIIIIIIIFL